jgi:NAD(P)-dependent dehydrogenase (short-subunit alcohol dehydrogenase family)
VRLCRCPSLLKTTTGEHKKKDKNTDTSINHQVTSLSSFYYLTLDHNQTQLQHIASKMVATSTIVASNARFAKAQHNGCVCVFAGATAGIGLATLKKLAASLHSSTFYILGRSPSRYMGHLNELENIGPSNNYTFVEAQASLISDIDIACHQITLSETKVDYLCMSQGGVPWAGATCKYCHVMRISMYHANKCKDTSEGLETCFAVSYYSRARLVSNLLPLLYRSSRPRVLSILNGTKEKPINEQDLGLEKTWGLLPVVNHTTLFTSLAFDYLAAHDDQRHITFVHATPGLVKTGSPMQTPKREHGWLRWILVSIVKFLSSYIVGYSGTALEESGERHTFVLTSDSFQPGSWRVDKLSNVLPDNEALVSYQQRGWADKIWEYTQGVWDKALVSTA